MKIILAKNKDSEFELDLPQFGSIADLNRAKSEFRLNNFPDRHKNIACFEFYLQFLPESYTVKDIMPNKKITKDLLIKVYGEEDGLKRFKSKIKKDKIKGTLDGYISRYGDVDGPKKYNEKNSRLSVSQNALKLNGFSQHEIADIRKRHSDGSKQTIENFILRYGRDEGEKRYVKFRNLTQITSFHVQYWIDRGYSPKEAKRIVSKNSTHDLKWFIKFYGEVEGPIRYEKCNKLKIWKSGNISKPEQSILNFLIDKDIEVINTKRLLTYFVDIFIPQYNTVIEFFGDYWHCNPKIWKSDDYNQSMKMTAGDRWDADKIRINKLKSHNYNVIIIWEYDFYKYGMEKIYEDYIKTSIV